MQKLIVLSLVGVALSGCASTQLQSVVHRPQHHVMPAPMPSPVAPAPVTLPPGAPVAVTPLVKPRWYDETKSAGHWVAGKVRAHVPHFHHKAAAPDAQKGN